MENFKHRCGTCDYYSWDEPCSFRDLYVDPEMSCPDWKSEIKPCLFCGGRGELFNDELHVDFPYVSCKKCGAAGPDGKNNEEAIRLWNTRVDSEYGAVAATEENMRKYGWVKEKTCTIVDEVSHYDCLSNQSPWCWETESHTTNTSYGSWR